VVYSLNLNKELKVNYKTAAWYKNSNDYMKAWADDLAYLAELLNLSEWTIEEDVYNDNPCLKFGSGENYTTIQRTSKWLQEGFDYMMIDVSKHGLEVCAKAGAPVDTSRGMNILAI
jgi:hypothetical protein